VKYPIKNIMLIITAILLVGGAFLFNKYRNDKAKALYVASENKSISILNTDLSSSAEEDSDSDGSKDWEEILVGTDPKNPKDKPNSSKNVATADLTKRSGQEKLEPIDLISREFFARYMELRQSGTSKDKPSQEILAERTAGNIVLSQPGKYELKDIITKPENDIDSIKQYGKDITNIFQKNAVKARNEAVIAKEAFESEDFEILKEIDPSIDSYKNIINSLLKLRVPKTIETLHLDLINAMNGSLFVAKSFRNSGVNPVEGVQAVQYYPVVQRSLFDAINGIKSYFKYLGINEQVF
jgi:hypothetical protein